MRSPGRVRPILVFAYGNPSRGDDALGPLLIEHLEARQRANQLQQVELLTDFQLQVEHALDLRGRAFVVFVDASSTGPEPYSLEPVLPEQEVGYTTHAMTPGAVLRVFEQITGESPPPAHLLAIRGYAFDLGSPLTQTARENLAKAAELMLDLSERSA